MTGSRSHSQLVQSICTASPLGQPDAAPPCALPLLVLRRMCWSVLFYSPCLPPASSSKQPLIFLFLLILLFGHHV